LLGIKEEHTAHSPVGIITLLEHGAVCPIKGGHQFHTGSRIIHTRFQVCEEHFQFVGKCGGFVPSNKPPPAFQVSQFRLVPANVFIRRGNEPFDHIVGGINTHGQFQQRVGQCFRPQFSELFSSVRFQDQFNLCQSGNTLANSS